MSIKEELVDYVSTHGADFIGELGNALGSPEDDFISMEDFDPVLDGRTPYEIAHMIHFGEYNPGDDYFIIDGSGNIQTFSTAEAAKECEGYAEEIADYIVEHPSDFSHISEIEEILNHEEEE